jgi:glycosyltransferase involved in cell wall biosynthesis
MPVYNGEQYIEESIHSNLKQTFDDFRLYIADNASTDRTEEICRDLQQSDERIEYIRNPKNLGASKNYTVCFEPATSEYFRWSNADDTIEPTYIEQCVEFLDENQDYVLVYGQTHIIDLEGNLIEPYDDKLDLPSDSAVERFRRFKNNIGLSNVLYGLMRREQLGKTALLGNYVASDINLIGELTLYGKFKALPEHQFNRRMHPDCSSWDRDDLEKQKDFWDPSSKGMSKNTIRQSYEYYKAAIRAPIGPAEKLRLLYWVTKSVYWQKQLILRELGLSRS